MINPTAIAQRARIFQRKLALWFTPQLLNFTLKNLSKNKNKVSVQWALNQPKGMLRAKRVK